MRPCLCLGLMASLCIHSALSAPPSWWTHSEYGIILSEAPENNLGPANVGQLKNVAKKSAAYLNDVVPRYGAGAEIDALIGQFEKSEVDLSPANVGQLKRIAKLFYDRLIKLGYDTKASLRSHGAPSWNYVYPWNPNSGNNDSLAPVTIGQLKWVFSFDLTGFVPLDTDGDGLLDIYEIENDMAVTDPDENSNGTLDGLDDSDGDGVSNVLEQYFGTELNNADSDGDGLDDWTDPYPTVRNPGEPKNVNLSVASDDRSITLSWEPADYGPTEYVVEERTKDFGWEEIATIPANSALHISRSDLLANKRYVYRITSFKDTAFGKMRGGSSERGWEVNFDLHVLSKHKWMYSTKNEYSYQGFPVNSVYTTSYFLKKHFHDFYDPDSENYVHSDTYFERVPSERKEIMTYESNSLDTYHIDTDYDGVADRTETRTRTVTAGRTTIQRTKNNPAETTTITYSSVSSGYNNTGTQNGGYTTSETISTTPTSRWDGATFDPNTPVVYYGVSEYSDSKNSSGNYISNRLSNGQWSGKTFSLPLTVTTGAILPTISEDEQGNTSTSNPRRWTKLSVPYTTEAFVQDVLNQLPDYTNSFERNNASYGVYAAARFLTGDGAGLGIGDIKYKYKGRPSVPFTVAWREVDVPETPSAFAGPPLPSIKEFSEDFGPIVTSSSEREIKGSARSSNGGVILYENRLRVELSGDENSQITYNNVKPFFDKNHIFSHYDWQPGGGYRIFPDAHTPDDNVLHNRVRVDVYGAEPKGSELWLEVIDVDDPTPKKFDVVGESHIVDPGDDEKVQGNDNKGEGGYFIDSAGNNKGQRIKCYVNEDGLVRVAATGESPVFVVSVKPGDNYRIAAAYSEVELGKLQVANSLGRGYVESNSSPALGFGGSLSEMLTVWRKLYVEIDSMEESPQPPADHFVGKVIDHPSALKLRIEPVSGDSSFTQNFYYDGKISRGNVELRIQESVQEIFYIPRLTFTLKGPSGAFSANSIVDVFDDDDFFLKEAGLPPSLPLSPLYDLVRALSAKYAAAYIEVVDVDSLGLNPRKRIPFASQTYSAGYNSAAAASKDVSGTEMFWARTLVFCYQPDEYDRDPDYENGRLGSTPFNPLSGRSYGLAMLYMETIRDSKLFFVQGSPTPTTQAYAIRRAIRGGVYASAAHELGHFTLPYRPPPAALWDHMEGEATLMGDDPAPAFSMEFSPKTIDRFRNGTVQW